MVWQATGSTARSSWSGAGTVIGLEAIWHPHHVLCVMLLHFGGNGKSVGNYIIDKISAHRGRVAQIIDLDGCRTQG